MCVRASVLIVFAAAWSCIAGADPGGLAATKGGERSQTITSKETWGCLRENCPGS